MIYNFHKSISSLQYSENTNELYVYNLQSLFQEQV